MEYLEQLLGRELGLIPTVFIALVIVLLLLIPVVWLFARISSGRIVSGGRGRQQRLSYVDHAVIDARRRIVLVRRDHVEHLLLIGGTTDIVVETNIVRPGSVAAQNRSEPSRADANDQTAVPPAVLPDEPVPADPPAIAPQAPPSQPPSPAWPTPSAPARQPAPPPAAPPSRAPAPQPAPQPAPAAAAVPQAPQTGAQRLTQRLPQWGADRAPGDSPFDRFRSSRTTATTAAAATTVAAATAHPATPVDAPAGPSNGPAAAPETPVQAPSPAPSPAAEQSAAPNDGPKPHEAVAADEGPFIPELDFLSASLAPDATASNEDSAAHETDAGPTSGRSSFLEQLGTKKT